MIVEQNSNTLGLKTGFKLFKKVKHDSYSRERTEAFKPP